MLLRNKLPFWLALNNYVEAVVSGVPPLTLSNAKTKPIKALTAFGGTEHIPETYIDTVTADGKCEQSNLPDGYVQQQYISIPGGSYLAVENQSITSDYKIEFDFATTNLSTSLANYFGARASGVSAGGGFRVSKLSNSGVAMYGFDTTDAYESGGNIFTANTRYKYVYENGTCKISSGGTDVLTHTYTVNDTSTITAFGINAYTSNGTSYAASGIGIYCYGLKLWNEQGELVMDLVPAIQQGTVPVVGFYDTVSETFKSATAGTFEAGGEALPTPNTPMNIICNNGVVKASKNLYNYATRTDGYYIDANGNIDVGSGTYCYSALIPVQSNTSYTLSGVAGVTNTRRVHAYNSSGTWISQINFAETGVGQQFAISGTTPNNCAYIRISIPQSDTNVQVEKGSTATTYMPYGQIYTDGTVETINVHTKNLFDEQWNRNTGTSTQTATWGQVVTAQGWSTSGLVPVKAGQQYTVSYNTTVAIYVFYYESDGTMQQSYDYSTSNTKKTFTVPNGATHIRLQVNKSTEEAIAALETQLETGATATDYVPYFNGGTATAEMLLSVGTYTDEQEVIAGNVTRKVGVKVLDGTESWTSGTSSGYEYFVMAAWDNNARPDSDFGYTTIAPMGGNIPGDGIHFYLTQTKRLTLWRPTAYFATLADWTQYLADQYNAGTPVIVVYPLATPTTESVAGQPMATTEGDNIAEITQASLDGLELSVKYLKRV